MKRLAIFGAGGHGKVVAEIAHLSGWSEIIFFDDNKKSSLSEKNIKNDLKMFISRLEEFDGCVVAIGDNQIRAKVIKQIISRQSNNLVSLIHPSAIVSELSRLAAGSVVMAGSVINPYSTIGLGAIINTNSVVDHDNFIGDYVHISPGVSIAGNVEIGIGSWIGIGSSIIENIKVGDDVLIGAGSVVIDNIPNKAIAYGVPAKIQT
jgi:sugar O-acyltransferase (sialic acid O-acetyltransferase NeuD family)